MGTAPGLALVAALAAGSAGCVRPGPSSGPAGPMGPGPAGARADETPPPGEPMEAASAPGLYRSTFGPVKIELDDRRADALMGVWVYDRAGQEVIGFFAGGLDGNVLAFDWQEPGESAPLRGQGYLVFAPDGSSFYGRWWSEGRERGGEWSGTKAPSTAVAPAEAPETAAPPAPTYPPVDAVELE